MKTKLLTLTVIFLLASTSVYAGGGSKNKPPQRQSASATLNGGGGKTKPPQLQNASATLAGGGSKIKPPQADSASAPWYVVWLGW